MFGFAHQPRTHPRSGEIQFVCKLQICTHDLNRGSWPKCAILVTMSVSIYVPTNKLRVSFLN
uniref:Uncharacterized protein n=1 Tax=Arundo donax TaxID=35708 RepID=A0A0A9C7V0_ARUDO